MTIDLDKLKALCDAATESVRLGLGSGGPTASQLFYDAARTAVPELIAEVERLRTVYAAAVTIRNGRYSVRSRLTSGDRTAFDVFNQAIDTALAAEEKAK